MSLASEFGELLGRQLTDEELAGVHDKLAVGFAQTLGLRYTKISPDEVRAQFEVTRQFCQPMGLLHGGVYASLVEDVASVAASWWLGGRALAVGANNSTRLYSSLTRRSHCYSYSYSHSSGTQPATMASRNSN